MLQRSTQVGEFYRMAPPNVFDTTKALPATYMDIMVYDEEQDMHVMLPFAEALNATCYASADASVLAEKDVFGYQMLTAALVNKMVAHAAAIGTTAGSAATALVTIFVNGGANVTEDETTGVYVDKASSARTATAAAATTTSRKADRQAQVDAIANAVALGVWVPIEIVIARPFIQHLMLSAIVAVAGSKTGATLFGCAVR